MRRALLTVAGIVAGNAAMVVLITLAQESWLGGIGWNESPPPVLAVGGLRTCVAGAAGGELVQRVRSRKRVAMA